MARQLFEYHPKIGYRFIPNLKARVPHSNGGYIVRTNSWGFRSNGEFATGAAVGRKRILVFGDSFTAGDCVVNEDRYTDVLESLLPGCEIYNFGISGTGTDQQYLAFLEFAKNIEHDLLIIAVQVENVRRNAARYRSYRDDQGKLVCFAKPYFELSGARLELRNFPPPKAPMEVDELPEGEQSHVDHGGRFNNVLRTVAERTGLKEWMKQIMGYQPLPEYDSPNSPAWTLTKEILRQWIRTSASRPLVMPLPLYHYIEEVSDAAPYQARFTELAESSGCRLHDPLPFLQSLPLEQRRRFRFGEDCHYTPVAHRVIAESLSKVIKPVIGLK